LTPWVANQLASSPLDGAEYLADSRIADQNVELVPAIDEVFRAGIDYCGMGHGPVNHLGTRHMLGCGGRLV
jgi:hypothetical protein